MTIFILGILLGGAIGVFAMGLLGNNKFEWDDRWYKGDDEDE